MYILLSGAKKNIGDFIITDRSIRLLENLIPNFEYKKYMNNTNLDTIIEEVNNSEGLILLGGPGYHTAMYDNIYKLTEILDDIKVPIYPLGLGWTGFPGDQATLNSYKFNENTKLLLSKIENNVGLSARDYLTKQVLHNNGYKNVYMTGCPVWYDVNYIGLDFIPPQKLKRVVFTPPQNKLYRNQSMKLMKELKKIIPNSHLFCVFHRGIDKDENLVQNGENKNNRIIAEYANKLGYTVIDAAYDLNTISFYSEADIHIGYRVHGHLHFLSQRKPSYLIHEDGRGRGMSDALNHKGYDAFRRTLISYPLEKISNLRGINRLKKAVFKSNNEIIDEILRDLQNDIENNWIRHSGVFEVIDKNFDVMKNYIQKICKK